MSRILTSEGDPGATQRAYYRATAGVYDGMHECAEHLAALSHTAAYLAALEARTVLDTGCGTGLAMRVLEQAVPGLRTHGNDPSAELLRVAAERHGITRERLDCVASERLPYADGAFDAVVETGMLHHVPRPDLVIGEMLRVARQAIFISDTNSYGLGTLPARVAKFTLARLGLLARMNRRRRAGRDWYYTDGDGVAWSYSVFDSIPQIQGSCVNVIVIPTSPVMDPLADAVSVLFASHCLVVGFKQPLPQIDVDR